MDIIDFVICEACGTLFPLTDDTLSSDWYSYEDCVRVYWCDKCVAESTNEINAEEEANR